MIPGQSGVFLDGCDGLQSDGIAARGAAETMRQVPVHHGALAPYAMAGQIVRHARQWDPDSQSRVSHQAGTGTLDDSYHRFPAKPAFRLYRTPEQFHSGEPEGSVASALLPIANLLRHLPAVPC